MELEALVKEIAAAVFRVAGIVKHQRLKTELTGAAVSFVADWGEGDSAEKSLDRLTRIVSLARAVGEVSEMNAGVLLRELGNVKIALASGKDLTRTVDITPMFGAFPETETAIRKPSGKAEINPETFPETDPESGNDVEINPETDIFPDKFPESVDNLLNTNKSDGQSDADFEKRKLSVLDYVRQFPDGCQARQLVSAFPEISDRTIRNYIHALIEDGLVEKVGGGPQSRVRPRVAFVTKPEAGRSSF